MSKELETYRLERTVISQAHEIADLKRDANYMMDKFYEAEKRCQEQKDRAGRYGGLIIAIGNIINDEELAHWKKVTTIATLVNQWEETEVTEV